VLMLSSRNILSPAHGLPLAVPSQDMVLGIYYLTKNKPGAKGEGRVFGATDEVVLALEAGEVELLTPIRLRYTGEVIDLTTAYDNQDVPHTVPVKMERQFHSDDCWARHLQFALAGKISLCERPPQEKGRSAAGLLRPTCASASRIPLSCSITEGSGFTYATKSGISIGIDDMLIPSDKYKLVENAEKEVVKVQQQYLDGAITNGERYNKVIAIWGDITERVADEMFKALENQTKKATSTRLRHGGLRRPRFETADSPAFRHARLMAKPSGEVIETPITSNFREGLTVLQYFISTHGARKGLADTALKTADSGYLTRRLVDVAQDVIINERDCGTTDGIYVEPIIEAGVEVEPLRDRIVGRVFPRQD